MANQGRRNHNARKVVKKKTVRKRTVASKSSAFNQHLNDGNAGNVLQD